METRRLWLFNWLVCASLVALILSGAMLITPVGCYAQFIDEEELFFNELNSILSGYSFLGVKVRSYPVQNGAGIEYYKGSRTVQVEYTAVDANRNGTIDSNEQRMTVRYGGQTASSTYDFNNYNPSDTAFALLVEGLQDLFGFSGGLSGLDSGGATQSGSSTSTLNSTFNEAILPTV